MVDICYTYVGAVKMQGELLPSFFYCYTYISWYKLLDTGFNGAEVKHNYSSLPVNYTNKRSLMA